MPCIQVDPYKKRIATSKEIIIISGLKVYMDTHTLSYQIMLNNHLSKKVNFMVRYPS